MRETHGCARSRFYKTWVTIHHRCYNPNYKDYKNVGGLGIAVCAEWHRDNPNGAFNFVTWCEEQVAKNKSLQDPYSVLAVARKKRSDNYSPLTCKVGVCGQVECPSGNSTLTDRKVINLRRLFRSVKTVTITELSKKYKIERHALRCALNGENWSRVNEKEPPLTEEEMRRQRKGSKT